MRSSAPSSPAPSCRTPGTFRTAVRDRFDSLSSVFLLPIFFAYTGLRTHLGLLDDVASWTACVAIIVVATTGKLGGTAVAARWTGLPWRDAVALGALMNTRGLMELVALNVGYDLGILSPAIFTMMVVMALVTTAMTGPLLTLSLTWARRPTIALDRHRPPVAVAAVSGGVARAADRSARRATPAPAWPRSPRPARRPGRASTTPRRSG